SAVWSADGRRIVFSQHDSRFWRFASKMSSRIRSIRPDGTGLRTLAASKLNRSRGKGYSGPGLFTDIDISGTDGRMLVTRERNPGGSSDIVEFDPQSGGLKRVVRAGKEGRWSPDGSSVLFLSDRDRSGEQCYEGGCDFQVKLYTANPDGTGQRRVQSGKQAGTIFGADWSPDGSRIAFGSDRNMPGILGLSMEIYSIRPDGSCLTWLTNGAPESGDPNWSPASGPDSDPGSCGATGREVVIDPLPSPRPRIGGKRIAYPRLWPGPVHQGKVLTLPYLEGDNLIYFDCAYFRRSACPFTYTELDSREICAHGLDDLLDNGGYRGMTEHRDALVTKPATDPDENRQVLMLTGRQLIEIQLEDELFRKPTTFAEYLGLIDELRPVGRDDLAGTALERAVFPRSDVRKAARIARAFARSGSVPAVARTHRLKRRAVRAYVRFERDLKKVGPVRTIGCPRPRR
ncbi:MAG: hypothetical protein M3Y23_04970, partial [Actinomycetota bacterium]|nr:hypothetical protein [Actinomycetota bacterium]